MELDARIKAGPPILILPTGSLEQHGPHLPLNTDTTLPLAVAESGAARIGALVTPPLPYGYKSQPKSGVAFTSRAARASTGPPRAPSCGT